MMIFLPFTYILITRFQCLSISCAPISFLFTSTDSSSSGWLVASLKVKVLFTDSMFEDRGLAKLGIFSGEDLALSSWWSRLAGKLSVFGIMDLVVDMATDKKRETKKNTLGITFPLLYFYWILLLRHNPKMRRFSYYGIRLYDCEGMSCSSPLGEASVAAYSLISIWLCTLLYCLI